MKAQVKLSNQNVSREVTREISLRNSLYGNDMTDDIKVIKTDGSGSTITKVKDCQMSDISQYVVIKEHLL